MTTSPLENGSVFPPMICLPLPVTIWLSSHDSWVCSDICVCGGMQTWLKEYDGASIFICIDLYATTACANISQIFCIWQGGLSIYGALLGFLATSIVFLRKYGYNLWLWFDLMMPSILFGLIILQLANFQKFQHEKVYHYLLHYQYHQI